jgi:hypothetical protein
VTYTDTAVTPNSATRTISFAANDGTQTSPTATKTVTVADTDQTPVVTTSTGTASFVAPYGAAGPPVQVDPGLTVTDSDNTTLASATVSVTGNFRPGQDLLAFTNNSAISFGNITASFNSGTGVLTFTSAGATATVAQWQAALRTLTFTDTSTTPDSATRTVSFVVSDGTEDSAAATRSVAVSQLAPAAPSAALTTTAVSSSANPAKAGQPVTLSIAVSPVPNGGTVGVTVSGSAVAGCSGLALGSVSGTAECTFTPSGAGTVVVEATYSGDQAFAPSAGSLSQAVVGTSTTAPAPPPTPTGCALGGQSQDSAFLCQLYEDLLGRSPDPSAQATWSAALEGGASRAEVARDILASAEYRHDLVAGYYQAYLGRAADPAGLAYWTGQLNSGASNQSVLAGLLGSAEYYSRTGGTPATFVDALYQALLGRTATATDLAHGEAELAAGTSRASVALGVLSSADYDRAFVEAQYQMLLGRLADAGGLASWVAVLASGGSEASVIAGIAGSPEFLAIAGN